MPDLPGAQLLGLGREAHEGIRVAIDEELDRLPSALDGPPDVLLRIEADIAGHARDEGVGGTPDQLHDGHLAFEVSNSVHAIIAKQLEAAGVVAGQYDHGITGLDPFDP